MKKLVLLFVAIIGLSTVASAQKIGRVRTNEIMESLPDMDSVKVKFTAYQEEMQKEYQVMVAEFQKKYEDYEKNRANLSTVLLNQKTQELEDAQRRLQEYQNDATQEANSVQAALLTPLTDKVKKSIDKIAKSASLIMVVEDDMANTVGSPFPFINEASIMDITSLVIKDLGGKTPAAK